jgi:opacity protein-like surface antigen
LYHLNTGYNAYIIDYIQGFIVEFDSFSTSRVALNKTKKLQLAIAASFMLISTATYAVEIEKKIIVTSGVEHDSNPDMSVNNKNPVWLFTLLPQFQLDLKDDLNRWYLDAGLEILRYSNEKAVANQENPRLTAGWERAYESGSFGVKASYQETTARTEELNNTGTFNNFDNTQTTKLIGANWQHRFAPRWSVLTDASYSDVKYSVAGALEDYTLASIKSKVVYENNERLNTYGLIGYSKYEPDLHKNTNLTRAALGADYQISEGLTISPHVGMYNLSGRQSDSDWEAGIKADYNTPTFQYGASIARDVEDSGLGFRIVDSVKLGAQYSITERDRIGADYGFSQFKKDSSLNVNKLDAQSLGVFYARNISEHWLGRVYLNHKELDFSGSNPKGNVIGFTLVFDTLSF